MTLTSSIATCTVLTLLDIIWHTMESEQNNLHFTAPQTKSRNDV